MQCLSIAMRCHERSAMARPEETNEGRRLSKSKRISQSSSKPTIHRSKHAPAESLLKRPVSRVREISGLENPKNFSLHTDIRFDPAYGVADRTKARKDYAFLDEYRKTEIATMRAALNNKALDESSREEIKFRIQLLQSRLDTLKNRDLELQIIQSHKREQMTKVNSGTQAAPFYLKKSDQRRLVQKAKFDLLKALQREKVMERKRKRRLGKEFKQLEFNRPS